jgi:hypothetical protein
MSDLHYLKIKVEKSVGTFFVSIGFMFSIMGNKIYLLKHYLFISL